MSRFLRNATFLGRRAAPQCCTAFNPLLKSRLHILDRLSTFRTWTASATSKFRDISESSPLQSEGHDNADERDFDYGRERRPRGSRHDNADERDFDYGRERQPRGSGRWEQRGIFDSAGFRDSDLGEGLVEKDWSRVELEGGVVNNYNPLSSMTSEEAAQFRSENHITFVTEQALAPVPVRTFDEAGFPKYILDIIENSGFESPMPIQAQGWPIALTGRDLIAIGQTGSGKTLGYLLPALVHVGSRKLAKNGDGPSALVLAPTRELAQQIDQVLSVYARRNGVRSTCLFGGSSKQFQIRTLQRGVDVAIATPGRLIDLLEMEVFNLERCTYLVLDEADRMLDMGFEPQIRKIVGQIRPDRQMLMWSATWPDEVKDLAEDLLAGRDKAEQQQHVHLNIGSVDLQANPNITQNVQVVEPHEKQSRLLSLLRQIKNECNDNKLNPRILVFVETKRTVDYIERILQREGYNVAGIHGGKTQMQRDRCLHGFRKGRIHFMVATDVASRGLDVDDIEHVINYDFPNTVEDYVHRIGRTARRDKKGTSHAFFTMDNVSCAKELVKVMKKAGQEVPEDLEALRHFKREKPKSFRSRGHSFHGDGGYDKRPRYSRFNRDFTFKPKYAGGED